MERAYRSQLPPGFDTWISFFDYLDTHYGFSNESHEVATYVIGPEEKYTINVEELKVHCFDELQKYRVDRDTTQAVIACIRNGKPAHSEHYLEEAVVDLLQLLRQPEKP